MIFSSLSVVVETIKILYQLILGLLINSRVSTMTISIATRGFLDIFGGGFGLVIGMRKGKSRVMDSHKYKNHPLGLSNVFRTISRPSKEWRDLPLLEAGLLGTPTFI